jgi:hypothetical protein
MDLTNLYGTTYLSIFGVVILLICIALIFSQRATPLRTPQRIRGFGVELEISVLTLLVLVGLILSLSSIYIQVAGYHQQLSSSKQQLDSLNSEIASAKRQLEAAKKIDMTVYVKLPEGGNPKDMPKLGDLRGTYYLRGQIDKPIPADISRGVNSNSYSVLLKNVTPDTFIDSLEVTDEKTGRVWVKKNFFPLSPNYDLKKEEQSESEN